MTTIGFIGAGNIGGTVARLAVAAGYDVRLSNRRGPVSLTQLVDDLGPRARAVTMDAAATDSDLVVVTIPLKEYKTVPQEPLRDKVVIDTMNYYPERDGGIDDLRLGITVSELLQKQLPEAHVVRTFSSIYAGHLSHLARPNGSVDRSALPIAGNDSTAKFFVTSFLNDIGYDAIDVGPLSEGWRFERGTAAYCLPYAADPDAFQRSVPGERPEASRAADSEKIRALLQNARRPQPD
ncbi:NADPH-dependent F420 reductase [Mycobacteroides abscessus]|uniref:NADPH-dependent F420 reductase n=1 Tax=Mycobacteroides abscessus TaxID=36809 RepID=UPI000C262473|nr:NADPH-dependent F420 reductase [Mycobacteroides abscessus]